MPSLPSSLSSQNFEKALLERCRQLCTNLPDTCKLSRDRWGSSTVLCVDFGTNPETFFRTQPKILPALKNAAQKLGILGSIVFKLNGRIMGWQTLEQI
ncbi:MAG: hypothetical protein AAGG02_10645 [Cyanobacteria bacterium P01_H01_bin.15]